MQGEVWGVMPTFKRHRQLVETLTALSQQSRPLHHLVIVDNGCDLGALLDQDSAQPAAASRVTVLPQTANLGPAGALDVGLRFVLEHAPPDALVATFDDDDPPEFADELELLCATAHQLMSEDPRFGAVGIGGSRFEARRMRTRRFRNDELTGSPMEVDVLTGNHLPVMRLSAVRDIGTYNPALFFGFDDLEFFLRMRRRGWHVYSDSALTRRRRDLLGRTGAVTTPSRRLGSPDWRRYYSIRNLVYIANKYAGNLPTKLLIAAFLLKVLANGVRDPKVAAAHLPLTMRACRDGLAGRLGCTWPPDLTADGRLPSGSGRTVRVVSGKRDTS